MKESFRQSMAWLHTWTGLLVGWVLYFVFLTGTFGYLNSEVDRWMRPELPLASTIPPAARVLPLAEERLRQRAADAKHWRIDLPGGRDGASLMIRWDPRVAEPDSVTQELLDIHTGLPPTYPMRETGGGMALYYMHYALHYIPYNIAIYVVGVCTMFMLVAILSGVVTHRKIFADFFTFRPGRGQRSWLDGHNLLGVTALPFHVMITWSGLVFFMFSYMPAPLFALYPRASDQSMAYAEAYGIEREDESLREPALLTPLTPLLNAAEKQWGPGQVARIEIDNPGRANARVTFESRTMTSVGREVPSLRFDGVTGRALGPPPDLRTGPGRFDSLLLGLHEGRFAGPALRALYVIAGIAGTAMVGTSLVLWSTKRRERLTKPGTVHYGLAAVDVLNLGTIIGLPLAIAAYFWANRLLPLDLNGRGEMELHVLFVTWALAFVYAVWRPRERAWIELCVLTSAACLLLPALNMLTTHRHLGVTIKAREWVLVGFDLSALVAGLLFALLAHIMKRKQQARRLAAREQKPLEYGLSS